MLQELLQDNPVIVIDGLYSFEEYRLLQRELGATLLVIAIVSSRQQRYERLGARSQRPLDPAAAEARDLREIAMLQKGGPIAIADYTLLNDSTPAALTAALDRLLRQLGLDDGAIPSFGCNCDENRL